MCYYIAIFPVSPFNSNNPHTLHYFLKINESGIKEIEWKYSSPAPSLYVAKVLSQSNSNLSHTILKVRSLVYYHDFVSFKHGFLSDYT